jgi:hypothetical protein
MGELMSLGSIEDGNRPVGPCRRADRVPRAVLAEARNVPYAVVAYDGDGREVARKEILRDWLYLD